MKCKQIARWGMLTYDRCKEIMGRRRGSFDSVTLGPNTWLSRDGDDYIVRLYRTVILRYTPDGAVILNTDGHRSATTKSRLSQLSPVHITQKKYVWWVGALEFFDGMNVGQPQTARESMERDVRHGIAPSGILADYDMDAAKV
jgi:hypothetical protein